MRSQNWGAEISGSVEQAAAEEMGGEGGAWQGRGDPYRPPLRSGLACPRLAPSLQKAHPRLPEPALRPRAWTAAVSPDWSPSLCLPKPSAHCHYCSRFIFLIYRFAHLLAAPRSLNGSIMGRGKSSLSQVVERSQGHSGWAPPTWQPCSPVVPPTLRPGQTLDPWSCSMPCTCLPLLLCSSRSGRGCLPREFSSHCLLPTGPLTSAGLSSWGPSGVCPHVVLSFGLAGTLSCHM